MTPFSLSASINPALYSAIHRRTWQEPSQIQHSQHGATAPMWPQAKLQGGGINAAVVIVWYNQHQVGCHKHAQDPQVFSLTY